MADEQVDFERQLATRFSAWAKEHLSGTRWIDAVDTMHEHVASWLHEEYPQLELSYLRDLAFRHVDVKDGRIGVRFRDIAQELTASDR